MQNIRKYSCALLLLDSVAGMSEAMMKESVEKTNFWDNLDYASIVAKRTSVSSATTCSGGSAGGYGCSNVDMKAYLALEDIGCG
jgi:hypothetical protein